MQQSIAPNTHVGGAVLILGLARTLLLHLLLLHGIRTVFASLLLIIKKPAGDGSGGGWFRLPEPLYHLTSVPVLLIPIFKQDLVLPGR